MKSGRNGNIIEIVDNTKISDSLICQNYQKIRSTMTCDMVENIKKW